MGRPPKKYINPAQVKDLYLNKNISLTKIASILDSHPQTIKRVLQKEGIAIRKRSPAMILHHENRRSNGQEDEE